MTKRQSTPNTKSDPAWSCETVEQAVFAFRSKFQLAHATYHLAQTTITKLDSAYVRTTYASEWVSRYLQRNYVDIDPVLREGVQRQLPFDWAELELSEEALPLFEDAMAHGLGPSGYSIPIVDKNFRRALFSINSFETGEHWIDLVNRHKAVWVEAAYFIHDMAMNEIYGSNDQALHLSRREVECLTLAAHGKGYKDIAANLGISVHTAQGYLKSARHKLGCMNLPQAITEAIRNRIIDP
jgi:DNA-binding CsgD family transcriptional regulator